MNKLKHGSVAMASLIFSLGLTACSTMEVQSSKDPQANLAKYTTYSWVERNPGEAGKPNAAILEESITDDVNRELPAHGLSKAAGASPDLLVSYTANAKNKVTYGMAPGPWMGYGEQPYVTKMGSLTISFTDPKTNRVVWQGTATDVVGDAEASQKEIGKAVKEILSKYPQTYGSL